MRNTTSNSLISLPGSSGIGITDLNGRATSFRRGPTGWRNALVIPCVFCRWDRKTRLWGLRRRSGCSVETETETQQTMKLVIPELSLVVLIGPSGSGKSTFTRKYFKPTEVLASDYFRGLVCVDETEKSASKDAFETMHLVAARRMQNRRLTVFDATNV